MKRISGKSVFAGIAIGKIAIFEKDAQNIKRRHILDAGAEIDRVLRACEQATIQLQELYEKAKEEIGESGAAIFEVHQMMVSDEDYQDSIKNIIKTQNVNAEYAVAVTGDNFSAMFTEMNDEYMQARAADVKDISSRIVNVLLEKKENNLITSEPVIILAEDLAPSETIQFDKSKVLAFITRFGSSNSHTAILARTMNIPALINLEYTKEDNGKIGIVDGYKGLLIIDPDENTIKEYEALIQKEEEKKTVLRTMTGKETITKSGKKINLYANIGSISDIGNVMLNDGEGIGLFRSEFLYLESSHLPTEEEQFQAYKTVAERMSGKKVIIRTLDIGADKQVPYLNLGMEENPAMGYRAIRICLQDTELFKTQLRAIFRASAFGNIAVMYPMIISLNEVRKIKELVKEVQEELKKENYPFTKIEQGIMIETPAAVMISERLAEEVDFFSIGTNDLTQYTLAIDRQNSKLDSIYDSHHEAVLRMIQMVIDNGHKNNCWVGICGELGADTTLTQSFIEMGIDELSVSPTCILPIRKLIRELP